MPAFAVQVTLQILAAQTAQGHQQHRTGWQGNQHPHKAQQLTKSHQGQNHGQWVQANALTHQAGREHKTLDQLPQAVHHSHHDDCL